ncbi:MAG: SDR family NAD(P)-dependent oxidoreductase [Alphaproteobacteria bacterium]
MRLKGKKIYLTGGTGGIGAPLLKLLLAEGAVVEVHDRRKDGDLAGDISPLCARLRVSPPDILINLAGYNELAYCEDQDIDGLAAVNFIAPMRLCQAVLPDMKGRKSGQIVNIGSMTALIPLPHLTGYVAAKAGLKAFSDALRRELSGSGVKITFITPRAVDTGANKGIKAELNRRAGVVQDAPEKVAQRICEAICGAEKDVRIGWPERFFAILNALLPSAVDKGLEKNRRIGEELLDQQKTQGETNEKVTDHRRLAS